MKRDDVYALGLSTGMYTLDRTNIIISVEFKRFIVKHRGQIDRAIKENSKKKADSLVSPLSMATTSL